jgi:hypothetical protein
VQLGCEGAHVLADLALELVGLGGRGFDPSYKRVQCEYDRKLVGCA